MSRQRTLSERDRQEWAAYVHRLAPPGGRKAAAPSGAPVSVEPVALAGNSVAAHAVPSSKAEKKPAPLSIGDQPGGVDRASWRRFRSGRSPSIRTLDLHGQTAQRAYHALYGFLHAAQA